MEVCCFSVHKNNFKKCFVAKLQFILLTFHEKRVPLVHFGGPSRVSSTSQLLSAQTRLLCSQALAPRCWKRKKNDGCFLGGRKACIKGKKNVILCWGHGNSHLLDEIPCLSCLKKLHLRWKISNWSSFQFTAWLKIIDHPQKCLQIGRPLYNDSSWQAWPKSYDFWSTISWVATRRKERSFQDRYCKSLPELRNRTSEQGGNGIMISCGWWAPTRYKQGHMTPLIGVKKKNREKPCI